MSKCKSIFFYRDYDYEENYLEKLATKCNTGLSQRNYLFRCEQLLNSPNTEFVELWNYM